jgi:hypothetical protein
MRTNSPKLPGATLLILGLMGFVGAIGLGLGNSESGESRRGEPALETTTEVGDDRFEQVVATVIECNTNTKCAIEVLQPYAVEVGPERAIAAVDAAGSRQGGSNYTCHMLYEFIGRAVTEARGVVKYHNSGCQFGYTHGVLYAMGERYEDVGSLITDALEYCSGYIVDIAAMNSPDSACHHGLGHALADVSYDDPVVAARACETAFYEKYSGPREKRADLVRSCTDGVFMEYGDSHLMRLGVLVQTVDEIPTEIDSKAMIGLCEVFDKVVGYSCYSRIWKFMWDLEGSVAEKARVCLDAQEESTIAMCAQGFGEMYLWAASSTWPPDTVEQAEEHAKKTAAECAKHPRVLDCLHGAMAASNSHLYAVGYEQELIPNPCKYVKVAYAEACTLIDKDVRRLNWNQTEGGGNQTGVAGGDKLG